VNACKEGIALLAYQILHSYPSVYSFLHPSPISIYTRYNSNVFEGTRCKLLRINLPYDRSSLDNFAAIRPPSCRIMPYGCHSQTTQTRTVLSPSLFLVARSARSTPEVSAPRSRWTRQRVQTSPRTSTTQNCKPISRAFPSFMLQMPLFYSHSLLSIEREVMIYSI